MSELNKLRNALKKAQNAKANLNIEYQGSSNNQRLTLDNNIKDANQSVKNAQKALANAEAASGKQEAVAEAASSNSAAANSSASGKKEAVPAAAAATSISSSSIASEAETAAPISTKKLISVERIESTNGKNSTFIAKVVEEASSSSKIGQPLKETPAGNAVSPNMLRTGQEVASNQKTSGGRRKRSHRKRSHKRTHKTHKRSHKSHKRIHR